MANPIGYHVMCRLTDDRVIAPTTRTRRVVAATVLEKCRGYRLLCFNAVDTHIHLNVGENRQVSGELARRIEIAVHYRLGLPVPFAPPKFKAIDSQRYLRTCFDYVLNQQPHHGLEWDPYREASNLPDLLGLRPLGLYTVQTIRQMLPRIGREHLLTHFGIEALAEADGPPEQIIAAALSAAALPALAGRGPRVRAVRRAVVEIGQAELSLTRLARMLGVSRQTLHRDLRVPVDGQLVGAIRLQLGLRQAVAAAAFSSFSRSLGSQKRQVSAAAAAWRSTEITGVGR